MPGSPPTGAGQVLRRFTLGSGPLRRGSDRLEFLARVVLLCSLLAAVPISLVVASESHVQAQDRAARDTADRHPVSATLREDAQMPVGEAYDSEVSAQGTAVWTDADGTARQASVSVPPGAKAGRAVPVWVDSDGQRTPPPMSGADVSRRAVSQGAGTFIGLAVLASLAYLWVRRMLDRSRYRRWTADWARVEPVWNRSVS